MNAVLEHPVLVLNRFWQPIHTCSVRRSLHLLCLGHAQVVQVEGEERFNSHDLSSWISYSIGNADAEMIHGARIAIRVPKIVVLSVYDRLPRLEVKFTRRNVFLRDKFTCQYCTKVLPETQLNLDHVTPARQGRPHHLGQHRHLVFPLQHPQGQQAAARGEHAPAKQAARPALAAALRHA